VTEFFRNRRGSSYVLQHQGRRIILLPKGWGVRILIVEDEPKVAQLVKKGLEAENFSADVAADGIEALEFTARGHYDLIVLDLMLPEGDGLDVCRTLRAQEKTKHIPILMLTAKTQEADRVVGLELGADDYITKPFSVRELIARIKAVLRRTKAEATSDMMQLGALSVDLGKHLVSVKG